MERVSGLQRNGKVDRWSSGGDIPSNKIKIDFEENSSK
jgi:hypothetical protein